MSRVIIYPFKMSSQSSKQLQDRLGAIRVYPDGNYTPRQNDLIINWGNSQVPSWYGNLNCTILNKPYAVRNASNKLEALRILCDVGINVPDFKSLYEMERAVNGDDLDWDKVVVRNRLCGHSGDGIEIINKQSINYHIPSAPLYTEYIPAKAEYRVHVFNGSVIDIAKKVRIEDDWTPDPTEEEMMIKSHRNGWNFARGGIRFSPQLGRIAIKSVSALELDFGAVDIILGEDNKYYTLEVNTAVGMEDSTENSYVTAILNYIINHD